MGGSDTGKVAPGTSAFTPFSPAALAKRETTPPPSSPSDLPPEALALATRLFEAARQGQTDIFEQVLQRSERIANLTNEKGDSLIMLASYHGRLPLTKLLLSSNADPNRLNERQQSPLAGAIFKGEDEIVDALLQGGADPRIGTPSAIDAVKIFGQEAKWGEKLRKAAKQCEERGGKLGNGHANGDSNPKMHDGDGDEVYEEAKVSGE